MASVEQTVLFSVAQLSSDLASGVCRMISTLP